MRRRTTTYAFVLVHLTAGLLAAVAFARAGAQASPAAPAATAVAVEAQDH